MVSLETHNDSKSRKRKCECSAIDGTSTKRIRMEGLQDCWGVGFRKIVKRMKAGLKQ